MANVLKREKQERVIAALVEGLSVRSTERMTGVHRDTIITAHEARRRWLRGSHGL